ncbi:hypothetical protein B0H17DRAFT_1141147 [Mycena rosella]|uniref:Uncharacterized protein n=1 Tax=Mycena rosella TaxID=1033263 RepID=A0AAD7D1R3_MYCRO|nr:hypothetical protein B0H17DRAFT_1141147 [Mycena rosella]
MANIPAPPDNYKFRKKPSDATFSTLYNHLILLRNLAISVPLEPGMQFMLDLHIPPQNPHPGARQVCASPLQSGADAFSQITTPSGEAIWSSSLTFIPGLTIHNIAKSKSTAVLHNFCTLCLDAVRDLALSGWTLHNIPGANFILTSSSGSQAAVMIDLYAAEHAIPLPSPQCLEVMDLKQFFDMFQNCISDDYPGIHDWARCNLPLIVWDYDYDPSVPDSEEDVYGNSFLSSLCQWVLFQTIHNQDDNHGIKQDELISDLHEHSVQTTVCALLILDAVLVLSTLLPSKASPLLALGGTADADLPLPLQVGGVRPRAGIA